MKKGTALRFAALIGLLALAAWLPVASNAEAGPLCSSYQGNSCSSPNQIVYCDLNDGTPSSCTCGWSQGPGLRMTWFCAPE